MFESLSATQENHRSADATAMIDDTDRKIIIATQQGLPLLPQPYHFIAEQIEVPVEIVMQRIRKMLDSGIIRRIGAVPNHYQLGYKANGMTVWNVPDEKIIELGEKVGALDFVSHCYHRPRHMPDWPYNLFAMIHARDHDAAQELVTQISLILGNNDRGHEVLYSSRILKKTGMRL